MQLRSASGKYSYKITGLLLWLLAVLFFYVAFYSYNLSYRFLVDRPQPVPVWEEVKISESSVPCPNTRAYLEKVLLKYPSIKDKEHLLLKQLYLESRCRSDRVGSSGEIGIAQFLAPTARSCGLTVDKNIDERWHWQRSIDAFIFCMNKYYTKHKSWRNALIAYNAGEDNIYSENLPPATEYYLEKILYDDNYP